MGILDGQKFNGGLLGDLSQRMMAFGDPRMMQQVITEQEMMKQQALEYAMKKKLFDQQQEELKQRQTGWKGLLGTQGQQAGPYQQSDAETFPGEQPIPGLMNTAKPGTGLYGQDPAMAKMFEALGPEVGGQAMAQMMVNTSKGTDPTGFGALVAEYNALPEGHPMKKIYAAKIAKESQFAPDGGGASPYYQFLPINTANGPGYAVGDARSGRMTMGSVDGMNAEPAQYSPSLQGEIAGAKALGTGVGEEKVLIPGKKNALQSVKDARSMLKEGIYSGAYGPLIKGAVKWTPGMDKSKAARTEQYISHIGNVVIPRLKEFGGNDSNQELQYLTNVMAGNISLESTALDSILASAETKIAAGITRLESGGYSQQGASVLDEADAILRGQ